MSEPSPYAQVGAKLVDQGYAAIPIMPGSKRPGEMVGGSWVGMNNWNVKYTQRLPTQFETEHWSSLAFAGIGVVTGYGDVVGIDIDVDDAPIVSAIEAALPYTPVGKAGQKGKTLFFRGPGVASVSFNEYLSDGRRGRRLCDIIGPGRQTVLPPTLHPDTGQPYRWVGEEALQNVRPEDLPEIGPDIIERLAEALAPFGYRPDPIKPEFITVDANGETPHRALNNMAMASLSSWVPNIGLYKLKPRGGGYVAVATWRASYSGRSTEQRQPNLKIHPSGIRDFHDNDKAYTPLDLVMAACGCDLETAYVYLSQMLGLIPEPIALRPHVEVRDGVAIDAETGEVLDREPTSDADPRDFPEHELHVPGLVGDIADWIMATSLKPVRLFATAAALVSVGTIVGRRLYCGVPESGTNLYLMTIAGTGAGKERPQDAVRQILDAVTNQQLHGAAAASSASLCMRLVQKPVQVQIIDEADRILNRMTGKHANAQEAQMLADYCTLFGRGMGAFMPDSTTTRGDILIQRPCLSFYGATTFHAFFEHMKSKLISNGFLNRFLVLPRYQRVGRNKDVKRRDPVPEQIVTSARALFEFMDAPPAEINLRQYIKPSTNILAPENPPEYKLIGMDGQALRMLTNLQDRDEAMLVKSDHDPTFEIWARASDMTKRVATIVACGRFADCGLDGAIVEEGDMVFASKLVDWSITQFITSLRENMVETEHQGHFKMVLGFVSSRRGDWVSRTEILKKMDGKLNANTLDGVLNLMIDENRIEVTTELTAGRPRRQYRLTRN